MGTGQLVEAREPEVLSAIIRLENQIEQLSNLPNSLVERLRLVQRQEPVCTSEKKSPENYSCELAVRIYEASERIESVREACCKQLSLLEI